MATYRIDWKTSALHGTEHTYRLRISDYRVLYEVHQSSIRIQIIRVRHRKDVYRH